MTINSVPELILVSGWMNSAGTLGFTPPTESILPYPPVAFVTNPISFQPRKPAADRFCKSYPGGFLLHTGWPNPGFRKVLRQYSPRWGRSDRPVWVHLLAEEPHELDRMVRSLEETEGVAAIEISFPPTAKDDLRLQLVDAGTGELPLAVCVPLDQVNSEWVGAAVGLGVNGLVVNAPRGVLHTTAGGCLRGRMYGPGLLPQLLQALGSLRTYEIPLIAGCGIFDPAAIETALSAGASSVQLDAALWRGWEAEKSG